MEEGTTRVELSAARCVSFRELSRSPAGVLDEMERDGKIFAISRYGRLVGLLVPLPDRVTLEFDRDPTPISVERLEMEDDVDIDALDLTDLAREFLIDAASTPTGYWHAPDSALVADSQSYFCTLFFLDMQSLTDSSDGSRRITAKGRKVAHALVRRGFKGYEEVHGESR